jgi:hypothetical protein
LKPEFLYLLHQKMPTSHHRRKHKHFQPPPHKEGTARKKGSAAGIMAIVGIIAGLAITYFAAQGSIGWIVAGAVAGAVAGYLLGLQMDKNA